MGGKEKKENIMPYRDGSRHAVVAKQAALLFLLPSLYCPTPHDAAAAPCCRAGRQAGTHAHTCVRTYINVHAPHFGTGGGGGGGDDGNDGLRAGLF